MSDSGEAEEADEEREGEFASGRKGTIAFIRTRIIAVVTPLRGT